MLEYYYDFTDHLDILLKVLADGGYSGDNFAKAVAALGRFEVEEVEVEIAKRNELTNFL